MSDPVAAAVIAAFASIVGSALAGSLLAIAWLAVLDDRFLPGPAGAHPPASEAPEEM